MPVEVIKPPRRHKIRVTLPEHWFEFVCREAHRRKVTVDQVVYQAVKSFAY